jgi:hypothetical protein
VSQQSQPYGGLFVEELLGDAPIELVHIHRSDAGFDLVAAGLELLDCLSLGLRRKIRPQLRVNLAGEISR